MRRLFTTLLTAATLAVTAGCCCCGRDVPVSLEPLNNWLCFHGKTCSRCPKSCPPCPYTSGYQPSGETTASDATAPAQPAAPAKPVDDAAAPFHTEGRAAPGTNAAPAIPATPPPTEPQP